jgi:toxin CptA
VQFPIVIGLHRSRFLDGALLLTTTIALTAISIVPWPAVASVLLGMVAVLAAFLAARALTPHVHELRIDSDGRISCRTGRDSVFYSVQLRPGPTAHPWLVVLRLEGEQGRFRLLIAPDSASTEDFRRLRVWLRWRAEISAGSEDS